MCCFVFVVFVAGQRAAGSGLTVAKAGPVLPSALQCLVVHALHLWRGDHQCPDLRQIFLAGNGVGVRLLCCFPHGLKELTLRLPRRSSVPPACPSVLVCFLIFENLTITFSITPQPSS